MLTEFASGKLVTLISYKIILGSLLTIALKMTFFNSFTNNAPLSSNNNSLILDDIWGQLLTKYYGKDYELDQLAKVGWSRIPHFYNSFYVYKYATGCSAGVSFAQDILKNGSDKIYMERK